MGNPQNSTYFEFIRLVRSQGSLINQNLGCDQLSLRRVAFAFVGARQDAATAEVGRKRRGEIGSDSQRLGVG